MKTLRTNKQGFTMVELLVVLVIIGILAAVATPIFLGNTQKAKASEAVATMSLIRQSQRDYFINNNSYIIPVDKIGEVLPKGVAVNTGVAQYFGNGAYKVDSVNQAKADQWKTEKIPAKDFIIQVNGEKTVNKSCDEEQDNCALKQTQVDDFHLEMDNTGRTYVSYEKGAPGSWQKF